MPQPFPIHEQCKQAAWDHGYRLAEGETEGWAEFRSTTAEGAIWLNAESLTGPWLLALDHLGVIQELKLSEYDIAGPGLRRYRFAELASLHQILSKVYQLATSLPDAPLNQFLKQTATLPKSTEAERLVIQRIGQDIFRQSLIEYWDGRCPLTGISDLELLRASHIVAWADCDSDAQRLDVHNGLLLSALWDAAFDRHLVSFDDQGQPQFSPSLSLEARGQLTWQTPLPLTEGHLVYLSRHRAAGDGANGE